MKNERIIKNYILNTSYQMLSLLVPLVTAPYISRVLGVENIGLHSYTYSVVIYFLLLANLGTTVYGSKTISILRDDPIAMTKKFWDIVCLHFIITTPLIGVYLVYAFFIAGNTFFALIQSFYLLEAILNVSWLFTGLEDFKRITIRNYIVKIINIAFIFVFVKEADDLWIYSLGLSMLSVLSCILILPYLPKYLVKIGKYKPKPFEDFGTIAILFIPTFAFQLYVMMDKILIGVLTGSDAENGYYEQSDKIIRMSMMLISGINAVILPQTAKLHSEKNDESSNKLLNKSYKFAWFMGCLLMFGAIGVSDILVPIFFGPGYEKIKILLPIMSVTFILVGINGISGSLYFISANKHKIYTFFLLAAAFINLVADLILIPLYLSIGAAFGAILGQLALLVLGIVYMKKKTNITVNNVIPLKNHYFLGGLLMLATMLFVGSFLEYSVLSLLLLIVLGGTVYVSVLLLFKDEFLMQAIEISKSIIKKIKNKRR